MAAGMILGIVASLGVGLSLGLVGAGGSILTVPILVYLLHVDPKSAVAVSLAVVAATSLLGATIQYRAGQVHLRSAALFGGTGALGAYLGSHLTHLLSSEQLMLAFSALMVVAATAMLRRREPLQAAAGPSVVKAALAGLATGVVTGFLGVGGGFLIVPALLLFAGLPARSAIGTSLAVIATNSLVGLAGALRHGDLDLPLVALVSSTAAAGMLVGTGLSRRLSPPALRKAFAIVALLIGGGGLTHSLISSLGAENAAPADVASTTRG